MSLDVDLLRSSFDLVVEREPEVTARFYDRLFADYPQAKPLFHRKAPEQQQKMLTEALVAVMDHLEDAAWLDTNLRALGKKHVEYGVTDEMYDWVGGSLVATLADVAGDAWTDDHAQAWGAALGAIAGMMQAGAKEA